MHPVETGDGRSPGETGDGGSRGVLWIVVITVAVLLAAAIFTAIAWPARWRTIRSSVHDYRWWLALAAVVAVAILVLVLVNKLLQRPWGAPWRVNILAAADALHYELDALPAAATPAEQDLRRSVGEAVEHHLKAARKAAWPEEKKRLSVGEQFLDWWTSAPCEAAYVNLHEAEIALAQILPDYQIQARIPEALARLQTMDVTDPRRLAAETQLASNLSESQRQAAFQSATRIGLELKDQQYDRLRAFRNIVLATAAALALLVAAACLVGAWRPDALPICSAHHRRPPRAASPRLCKGRAGWPARPRTHRRPLGRRLAASPPPATSPWWRSWAYSAAACRPLSSSVACRAPQRRTMSRSRLPCSSFPRAPYRRWWGCCSSVAGSFLACPSSTASRRSWPMRSCSASPSSSSPALSTSRPRTS
jgi:hypothetical protein